MPNVYMPQLVVSIRGGGRGVLGFWRMAYDVDNAFHPSIAVNSDQAMMYQINLILKWFTSKNYSVVESAPCTKIEWELSCDAPY